MKRWRKITLKVLSYFEINLKKYYKLQRKIMQAVNPYIKPLYNLMDQKIIVGDREIPVRIFCPQKQEYSKALLFFHGGGWVTGNIDSYTRVCNNLANQTGQQVISVDYRLAPENPFPAGVEDCYYVAKEIFLHPNLLQLKQEDITLIGDSAGANLAAVVSLLARDRGEFLPSKQILIYPATYNYHNEKSPFPSVLENGTDYILTAKRIEDYMDLYVQNEKERCSPYVAPILAQNLANQPQTLVITAEYDPLRDEGEAYGLRLQEFGNLVQIHRMKDALHGFFCLPWKSKYVVKCYQIINCFLSDQGELNEEL